MAYKRNEDFKKCLKSIVEANGSNEYHLIVTQSVSMKDYKEYNELNEILVNNAIGKFKSVTHLDTESSSKLPYGNAYFAFKNLAYGLEKSLKLFPNQENIIVFEEDVESSKDIFEFFDRTRKEMNQDKSIVLSTSAFFLHTTHSQYNWKLDKPLKRKSVRNDLSLKLLDAKEIQLVTLNGEIEFKVLSWMMKRQILNQLVKDFKEIENWVTINQFQDKIENKPNTTKPDLLVNHCDCWNHDRYLELRFKGLKFLGSQSPRCNHVPHGGKGLSNVLEDYGFPLNQIYTNSNQFYIGKTITGEKDIWSVVKDYLPNFECPNTIYCYNNHTNQYIGSVKVSTCLNVWGLECLPCSGRSIDSLISQCNQLFNQCNNNCETKSPFFISLKQH